MTDQGMDLNNGSQSLIKTAMAAVSDRTTFLDIAFSWPPSFLCSMNTLTHCSIFISDLTPMKHGGSFNDEFGLDVELGVIGADLCGNRITGYQDVNLTSNESGNGCRVVAEPDDGSRLRRDLGQF